MTVNLRVPALAAVAMLTLAACGKVGTLDQPGPLFGAAAKAKYAAEKKAAAEAKVQNDAAGKPEPLPPITGLDPPK